MAFISSSEILALQFENFRLGDEEFGVGLLVLEALLGARAGA
jgi:hypothetical protein